MELSKVVSIAGRPGLYKVISQAKNAVIVESLVDQKRFPAFGHEKMSTLEEISIFSSDEDIPLKDVFQSMHDKLQEKEAIDPKSDGRVLQEFFTEMVPEYDPERVYTSDIKKILTWYNLLLKSDLLDFSDEEEPDEAVSEKLSGETDKEKETQANQED